MNQITLQSVKNFLLNKYELVLVDHGIAADNVPDDFDLFSEGIVDSLGVLNMISDIENAFNIELDMEQMDAEQLTILGPLCRFIIENSKPRSVASKENPTNTNGFNLAGVSSDLRSFIRKSYSIPDTDQDFTDDVHLYAAGYIEPIASAGLKKFVELQFAIQLSDSDIATIPMNTIRELSEFIVKRQRGEI